MRKIKLMVGILLSIPLFSNAQSPVPAGFPSPYSTNYYRVGFLQEDSGGIYGIRDTTARPRFAGFRILWPHAGKDTSVWVYNGNAYIKQLNTQDTLPGRFLVTPSFLNSQGYLKNITGFLQQGTGGIKITGSGTLISPFLISDTTSGGSFVDTTIIPGLFLNQNLVGTVKTIFADSAGLSTYYLRRVDSSLYTTRSQLSVGLIGKQNTITTGATTQYFRGDFSLATFPTNLSAFTNGPGYITGNQSIAFTAGGDINGTFTHPTVLTPTLTINANVVSYSKIQTAAGQGLMGAQSAGNFQLVTLGSGLSMSGGVLSATGGGGGCLNCNADSLKKLPIDTSLRRNGYALTFDSINRKWVLAPNGSGSGSVTAVSNSDGTLTISPPTGAVVASLNLSHGNTWITSVQTFNGGLALGSPITFSADNTYSIGGPSAGANAVYARFLNSNGILALGAAAANPILFSIGGGAAKMTLLATGQLQLNTYTTSTSYTGTPTSFLQVDASGNVIQIPTSSVQTALSGTGYVKFSGTTPFYLTPTQATADLNLFTNTLQGLVPGSGGGTTNFLRSDGTWAVPPGGGGGDSGIAVLNGILATRTSGPTVFLQVDSGVYATRPRVQKPIDSLGTIKQPIGNYITGTTGDVVATGPGSVPATIQANAVTTSKINNAAVTLAKMAANTANTFLVYDGSGNPADGTLTIIGTSGAATLAAGVLNIPQYQGALTLTTTGTSGPATLIGVTLNIPQYSGGGGVDSGIAVLNGILATRTSGPTVFLQVDSSKYATVFSLGKAIQVIGAIDNYAPVANGLKISGDTLYPQSATSSFPGFVNNATQTFSGAKTLTSNLTVTTLGSSNIIGGNIIGTSTANDLLFYANSVNYFALKRPTASFNAGIGIYATGSGSGNKDGYTLSTRPVNLGFPVVMLSADSTGTNTSLDICPGPGTVHGFGNAGIVWIDLCDTSLPSGNNNVGTMRIAIDSTKGVINTVGIGSHPAKDMSFQRNSIEWWLQQANQSTLTTAGFQINEFSNSNNIVFLSNTNGGTSAGMGLGIGNSGIAAEFDFLGPGHSGSGLFGPGAVLLFTPSGPATLLGLVTGTSIPLILGTASTERARLVGATGDFLMGTTTDVVTSMFTLASTTQGMLITRMNTTQQNAIVSPANGLIIWNTDSLGLVDFNGTAWLKERAAGGGGGSGTVTTFSAGTLSPLFTTSVATATTTPALTFTLSTAAANSIFGNNTGSTAAPAYFIPTITTLNGWSGGSIALLGTANTFTALQTFGTLTTTGVTKFTGLTSSGVNDSVLTGDPTTGQLHWRSGTFNLFAANGLTAAGVDSIYGFSGTLNQTSSVLGAGFSMSLGATGSHISRFSIFADTVSISGPLSFVSTTATDANLTIGGEGVLYILPAITANRTITIPISLNSRMITLVNNNSSANSWTFSSTVIDAGGNPVTSIPNGWSYILQYKPAFTQYIVVAKYSSGTSYYLHTIFTPTTGGTVNLVTGQYNIINPAGALAAVTVNLPSSPVNNDVVYIKFTQSVAAVTYANGTVVDGIAAPVAGGLVVLTYDNATTSWY